jgi:hypothetical protein
MAKKKAKLTPVRAYLSPEQPSEAAIIEFVSSAVRMRSSATVRAMLCLAWAQMEKLDRETFEAMFPGNKFSTFERIRRSNAASQEADSLVQIPPSPKVK